MKQLGTDQLRQPKSHKDAVVFIFLAQVVNLLTIRERNEEIMEMAKVAFKLEEKIGEADEDTAPTTLIYNRFISDRQMFYASLHYNEQKDKLVYISKKHLYVFCF